MGCCSVVVMTGGISAIHGEKYRGAGPESRPGGGGSQNKAGLIQTCQGSRVLVHENESHVNRTWLSPRKSLWRLLGLIGSATETFPVSYR